jgi:2,5-furandicarboxylate decarboxylase 1
VLRQPITTLRGWLDHLERTDRLAIAKPGRDLRFEVAAIAKRLDGRKATLFPRPSGHPMPVISGLVSSRAWIAEAMGVPVADALRCYGEAAAHPLPWQVVTRSPTQELVHRQVDLAQQLPLPTHNELDSGPYVTAGLLIARNPRTGIQNVTIHRLQLSGRNRLGALLLPRHTAAFFDLAEQAGEALDVAVVIGVDPLTLLASQAIAPLDTDELEIAGALHGRPLEVIKCLSSEIHVPAHAEIVIEGRLLPGVREPEGPFGEFPQYYGPRADAHVVEVDLIAQRADALFHTIGGGGLEHLTLGEIPREATLLKYLQSNFPSVLDVHLAPGGVCRYHLYVRIRNRHPGQAKNIILAALSGHYDVKHVVVVDEDVDIHQPQDVEWAIATRFQADRDLVVVAGSQGSKLDPSTDAGVGAKMGLDATAPLDAPPLRYKRIRVPGEESVDLDQVIAAAAGTGWRSAR